MLPPLGVMGPNGSAPYPSNMKPLGSAPYNGQYGQYGQYPNHNSYNSYPTNTPQYQPYYSQTSNPY